MAEFCEGCPLRGETNCEIVNAVATTGDAKFTGRNGFGITITRHLGNVGVLVDALGNPSRPLKFPETTTEAQEEAVADVYIERVNACPHPTTVSRGIFKKREVVVDCPALGEAAIQNPYIAEKFMKKIRPHLSKLL